MDRNSWGFLLMHQAIRQDLDRMAALSAEFDSADPRMRARFSRWVEFLWMMIEHHHHNEDGAMFPQIRAADPSFDPSDFEADHQVLYAKFAGVRECLVELEGASERANAQTGLTRAMAELREFTADHLEREERACVDRLDHLFDAGAVAKLERESARTTPLRIMTKMVPWIMSAGSPEDRVAIRLRLPVLFRWLNDLFWQRSFDRQRAWI